MSDIREQCTVHCPQGEAGHYLAAFVAEHRLTDGLNDKALSIHLRLPTKVFAGLPLSEGDVVASVYALQPRAEPRPTYSVCWSAAGNAFPEFLGALAVEPGRDAASFRLVLGGHYEPPFGLAGAVFDATVGRRLVHGSIRTVLRVIATSIESAFAVAHGCAPLSAVRNGARNALRD